MTPPGRGGIAVLRCVGPGAEPALMACFRPARAKRGAPPDPTGGVRVPRPACPAVLRPSGTAHGRTSRPWHTAVHVGRGTPPAGGLAYGHILDAEGRPLDEVILCHLNEPAAGAAGDPVQPPIFEINCHGGPAAVAAVSRRLAELGLERVDPDRLLEIEGQPRIDRNARRLLRTARTPLAARILLDQLGGALTRALAPVAERLTSGRTAEACEAVGALLSRWDHCGRFLADPPRIVIAGRPNVGKSTLLNRLVGADRAITSPAPGTTRDYVEAEAALDGVPVVLVDTAGLGEGRDALERLGVERARGELARASLVLYLLDASEGAGAEDEAVLRSLGERGLAVWNKVDLAPRPLGEPGVSALLGEGVAALTATILARLGYQSVAAGDAVPFTAEQAKILADVRQLARAGKADAARRALEGLAGGAPLSEA